MKVFKKEFYALFKEGAYRQGCFGIFTNRKEAIDVANKIAESDHDDYHTYDVVPFVLDEKLPIKHLGMYSSPDAEERLKIHSVKKMMK